MPNDNYLIINYLKIFSFWAVSKTDRMCPLLYQRYFSLTYRSKLLYMHGI
jgi:hypothetical protein